MGSRVDNGLPTSSFRPVCPPQPVSVACHQGWPGLQEVAESRGRGQPWAGAHTSWCRSKTTSFHHGRLNVCVPQTGL